MQTSLNFKIIVLGSQGVGKSSLIMRYLKGQFSESYNVTIGVEFASKIVKVDDNKYVRLQIWDTAGQEYFRALVRSFYQGIAAVFFVYAVDKAKSFHQIKSWVEEVREHAHQAVVLFLIGSRADREEEREVEPEDGSGLLKEIQGAFFVETSAKTGLNIELLFEKAADHLYKKFTTSRSFRQMVMANDNRSIDPKENRGESIILKKEVLEGSRVKKKKCCN